MRILKHLAATALSVALATTAFAQGMQQAPSGRSTNPPPAASQSKPSTAPSQQNMQSQQGSTATQGNLVDINSASKDELQKLKGVGPARAEAIEQNRPYRAKTDLKTRKIVPDNVYNDIQNQIVARQGTAGSSGSAPSAGMSGSGRRQ
jgi:competence protein ComEA